jgi:hypothetical protein
MKRHTLKVEVYLPDDVPIANLALEIDGGMSYAAHSGGSALNAAFKMEMQREEKGIDTLPAWRVTLEETERIA